MNGNTGSARPRVLVVEDEPLIAMALEDTLTDLGYEVVGPALSLKEALRLSRHEDIDGAILDVNVAGEKVFPVADILATRSIPFVFVTGYGGAGLRECDRGRPILQKPYQLDALDKIARKWPRH